MFLDLGSHVMLCFVFEDGGLQFYGNAVEAQERGVSPLIIHLEMCLLRLEYGLQPVPSPDPTSLRVQQGPAEKAATVRVDGII
eukprot:2470652-Prymnesium_polylepis.1